MPGDRSYPLPTSISEAARDALAMPPHPSPVYPAADDLDGWRALVRQADDLFTSQIAAMGALVPPGATLGKETLGGVPVYRATPPGIAPDDHRIVLDFHGGALIYMGGEPVGVMAGGMAMRTGVPVVSVDYRMPPDHPYPAGVDDGVAVYRALLESRGPENIVVSGVSAGGNLAAAVVLRARDEGLPLPAAVVLMTPEVDLTESGDTFEVLMGVDPRLTHRFTAINAIYAGGEALAHPYVSPLFGDFSKGFPPTFLQSGTRDLYLSNTVRMHRALRAAGVTADLHVFEAMPHGGFAAAPEDAEVSAELKRFLARYWPAT